MQKIVLASNNQGKLAELESLFSDQPLDVIPQAEFQVQDADETGLTFIENAILKARHAAAKTQLPALADDSGLVVDALAGAPGIYSARYAGEHGNAQANINKLLNDMANVPEAQRTARFICVLAFMRSANDPIPLICQGVWEGRVLTEAMGDKGFGYDPVFWVPTHNCSAAELPLAVKNKISHRAIALANLQQQFQTIL